MLREHALQQFGVVVVGEADMFYQPLLLLLFYEGEAVEPLHLVVILDVDIVQKIVVEIVHAALFKLFAEYPLLVLLLLEGHQRHLRRHREGFARMALHKHLTQRRLARIVVVHIGGVKIGEATLEEDIHHLLQQLFVDAPNVVLIGQRKAHESKAQFFHLLSVPSIKISII